MRGIGSGGYFEILNQTSCAYAKLLTLAAWICLPAWKLRMHYMIIIIPECATTRVPMINLPDDDLAGIHLPTSLATKTTSTHQVIIRIRMSVHRHRHAAVFFIFLQPWGIGHQWRRKRCLCEVQNLRTTAAWAGLIPEHGVARMLVDQGDQEKWRVAVALLLHVFLCWALVVIIAASALVV